MDGEPTDRVINDVVASVLRGGFLVYVEQRIRPVANSDQGNFPMPGRGQAVGDKGSGLRDAVTGQSNRTRPSPADPLHAPDLAALRIGPDQAMRAFGKGTANEHPGLFARKKENGRGGSVIGQPLTAGIRRAPGGIDRVVDREFISEVQGIPADAAQPIVPGGDDASGRRIVAMRSNVRTTVVIHAIPIDGVVPGFEEGLTHQVADTVSGVIFNHQRHIRIPLQRQRDLNRRVGGRKGVCCEEEERE